MTTVVNLMSYDVDLIDSLGVFISFPQSGTTAYATEKVRSLDTVIIKGLPIDVTSISFEEPVNIPAPTTDTYYIVPLAVAQVAASTGRQTSDLLIPTRPVKDASGCTVGYQEFAVI